MSYAPVIGLEIHVELKTKSKMFCSCENNPFEGDANSNVCPVCMAHPGSLPVINEEAVKKVIKTGLALNCQIAQESKFDRKNYFYPDLPKGYQISQYDKPFCKKGFLNINGKKIRITRVHLEEDTGKLLHPQGADYSLVDFNRAGVPLMELVTEPDLHSAKEARKFAEELQLIIRYLGVSNADMEKGQLRVEVNISLSKNKEMGTKVEIKNLNSFRIVEKAIDYETERQAEVLDSGKKVVQETRGWDEKKGITVSQREKEEAHDYRYFPEPDLPTLHFSQDFINKIKVEIPELPQNKRERFKKEYGLNEKEIEVYISKKDLSEYFEKVSSELREWIGTERQISLKDEEFKKIIKVASNYLSSDLLGLIRDLSGLDAEYLFSGWEVNIKASPENFAEFVKMIYLEQISSKIAKMVLSEMIKTGKDPSHIIEEKGLIQITDEGEIEKIIKDVISKNPKAIEDYKKGKENALQFLIGQVMAKTKGRANPDKLKQLFIKNIKN